MCQHDSPSQLYKDVQRTTLSDDSMIGQHETWPAAQPVSVQIDDY